MHSCMYNHPHIITLSLRVQLLELCRPLLWDGHRPRRTRMLHLQRPPAARSAARTETLLALHKVFKPGFVYPISA